MPTDWTSPAEMAKESAIYAACVLVLAGVAAWDVLRTLPFDISIVTGRRKWRWPMALYFADRVFMLIHIFAYAVNLNAIRPINCDVVVWLSKITDFLGTCTSTAILALRTAAVWHQDKRVTIPLGLLCLGQVVLWTQTMRFSKSIWNPQRHVCQIISTSPVPLLIAVWSYTMTLDFVVMLVCSLKLWRTRKYGGLGALLLRDGMAYFAATFAANLLQTILAGLSLNPIMNIIALPFTLVVSVIACTAAFRNVFIIHDGFASASDQDAGKASGAGPVTTFGGTGARSRGFSLSGRNPTSKNHFALGTVKPNTSLPGGIEVHKVVDVDMEAGAGMTRYDSDRKAEDDDGASSFNDRDDKRPVAL